MNNLNYYKLEQVDNLHPGRTRSVIHVEQKAHISGEAFIAEIHHRCGLPLGIIDAVLRTAVEELAEHLPRAHSVEVPGLGTFSIGVRQVEETPEGDVVPVVASGDTPLPHHGVRIEVDRINFAKNRRLFREVRSEFSRMTLHRVYGAEGQRIQRSKYPQVRNRMIVAREFLQTHPYMTVRDYAELTGLSRSTAQRELRQAADNPAYGLAKRGAGSHRVYVLATPGSEV